MLDGIKEGASIERTGKIQKSLAVLEMLRNCSEPTETALKDESLGRDVGYAEKISRKDRSQWIHGIQSHFRTLRRLGIVFPKDLEIEVESLAENFRQARTRLTDGEELSLAERQEQVRRGDAIIDRIIEITNQQIN